MKTKTLPQYVQRHQTRHGKTVYYFCRPGARLVRLPDEFGTKNFSAALAAAQAGELKPCVIEPVVPAAKIERTLLAALRAARTRAKEKSLPFDLTKDWVLDQARAQNFRCTLTGIRFHAQHGGKSRVSPFVPSIDRIDCAGGYTVGNCRLIIFAMNVMLMDWGEPVFGRVARRYLALSTGRKQNQLLPGRQTALTMKKTVINQCVAIRKRR